MTFSVTQLYHVVYTLAAIAVCIAIGEGVYVLLAGLPPSLYGMIAFTVLLKYRCIDDKKVEGTIRWIIANMGVCFVPAGVGIIEHYELIAKHGFSIVAITFATTFLLMTCVGLAYQRALNKKQ